MLTFVNEDLMSFQTVKVKDTKKTGKEYTKILVTTSNKLQQYADRIDPKTRFTTQPQKKRPIPAKSKKNFIESHTDELLSINREILRISAPLSKAASESEVSYDQIIDFDYPMSINIRYQSKYQPQIDIRCHTHGEDRANIYIVAFPFNGMIRPLEEDPRYRIYKGLIASSAKPFFFNNKKYRKILYLVVEVNKNLFKEGHKHHTDSVVMDLESFALFDDRDDGKKKTNYEKCSITFMSAGNVFTDWSYKVIDEPVMMNAEAGKQLWPTYQFTSNKEGKTGRNRGGRFKNGQKPVTVEGDMLVTTNRHGIRKEVPLSKGPKPKARNRDGQGYRKGKSYDPLEAMMKDSGMYEVDEPRRDKRKGGNAHKKPRRR